MSELSGADVVAATLWGLGARVAFTVSGNQILSVMDACASCGIRLIHARHESAAAYMAEAWGRLHGEPGVCLVTAGPGHTSVLTAVASARAAEAPLLVLSGASPTKQCGRGAFQEVDQVAVIEPLTCFAAAVGDPGDLAPALMYAWHEARRLPGPAHLTLPVDVLSATAETTAVPAQREEPPSPTDREDADRIAQLIAGAERPVVVLRPALGRHPHEALLERLERRVTVLVAESPRGPGDPLWSHAGGITGADVVAILAPLDFAVCFPPFTDGVRVAHVEAASPGLLGELVRLLEATLPERAVARPAPPWAPDAEEPLHPLAICDALRGRVTNDDLLVIDGGELGQWIRAGLADHGRHQLINGKFGAIGGAIPQAVGAALACPGRRVLAFTGDGAFGYHAAELDTAAREGARLIVFVGNDARWGAEWHAQRARFGSDRTIATELADRDYELVARGYGAHGIRVRSYTELAAAVEAVLDPSAPPVVCINVTLRSVRSPAASPA